jgi:lysozyme family protein
MKKVSAFFLFAFAMLMSGLASATIDITGVTTGITDAQTAMTAIIQALLVVAIALFGLGMVYAFVHKRSPH